MVTVAQILARRARVEGIAAGDSPTCEFCGQAAVFTHRPEPERAVGTRLPMRPRTAGCRGRPGSDSPDAQPAAGRADPDTEPGPAYACTDGPEAGGSMTTDAQTRFRIATLRANATDQERLAVLSSVLFNCAAAARLAPNLGNEKTYRMTLRRYETVLVRIVRSAVSEAVLPESGKAA